MHGVVREAVPIKETTGCIIVQMKHPVVFDLIFWSVVVAAEGKIVLHLSTQHKLCIFQGRIV